MSNPIWPWTRAARVIEHVSMRWPRHALRTGRAVQAVLRWVSAHPKGLLLPLLAIGSFAILAGLFLTGVSLGWAHAILAAGIALTATTVITALLQSFEAPLPVPELDRFQFLSDRLEKGIEKLKDLQWELSDNETRYRDLLDSQNDIIIRRDTQGRLTFVNRAFCRTFGVEAGAVLGTSFQPEVLQHDGEPQRKPEPGRRQRFEELVLTADGARWFAFELHAITAEDDTVREFQLLGRDVTEQRRTQAALAEARDQAEAASKAKSRFLAAMSHEIRTPMNGILGMTSLLGETQLTPEQRSYVDAVDYSAKNLLTIIDEILDLSKIEAGKLEIHPAPFPLDDCLQNVVELMAPRAKEKQLDLAWRLDPDLPRVVVGDETRVRQILLNLVGNAIKFTDTGGVAVRVRRQASTPLPRHDEPRAEGPHRLGIEIEVADTGSGIAADQLRNLFTEFERADDAVRRKRSGTGLGLAISRRLAQAMGGDIEVKSVPGEGSSFTARLTLVAPARSPAVLASSQGRRDRLVLIVSRRSQQPLLMQETLVSLGIANEVAGLEAAADAIGAARRAGLCIDTIVADVEYGAEAVAKLLSISRSVQGQQPRAILVVDQAGGGRLEAFRSAGCAAYLVRPVRPASLLTQIDAETSDHTHDGGTAPVEVPHHPSPLPSVARGRRILLVEDNDINALLARRMSEKAGCNVHHAPSGRDALGWCEEVLKSDRTVDLVLMDIHMPEMDGFETARRVKRLFASRGRIAPPIVALTANAFAEDRKRCLEAGLDDYLAKPFERAELEALLDKWCTPDREPRDGSLGEFAA